MHRSHPHRLLVAAAGLLLLAGCTGGPTETGTGDPAPELSLPETTKGSVTALDGGLEEQFTVTLEDLTGAASEDCDEQGLCAILAEEESPAGTLLVHAWHEGPGRDRYLGLDSGTGEVTWTLAEEEGFVGSSHVSRHGPVLLGLTEAAPGEDHTGYSRALLLDTESGKTLAEVEIPENTARVTAIDTTHGIAVLAAVTAEGDGPGDPAQELMVLGIGADGTEHWRVAVDPVEDPDASYSLTTHDSEIVIEARDRIGIAAHAVLAPDTGDELEVPEELDDAVGQTSIDIDDGSVDGFDATRDPDTSETTIRTAGGEPWTVPVAEPGAVNSLRGVCGGLVIVAEQSPSGTVAPVHVRAFDPANGEERWAAPVQAQPSTLCADGQVLVHDRTTAQLLDADDGGALETYELAPGAIPVPDGGYEHEVPRSLDIRSASTFTAEASIVAEVHEAGELPQLSVYR